MLSKHRSRLREWESRSERNYPNGEPRQNREEKEKNVQAQEHRRERRSRERIGPLRVHARRRLGSADEAGQGVRAGRYGGSGPRGEAFARFAKILGLGDGPQS